MSLGCRNLAFIFWLHLPSTSLSAEEHAKLEDGSEAMELEKARAMIEKRTMINLIEGFAVSVKVRIGGFRTMQLRR